MSNKRTGLGATAVFSGGITAFAARWKSISAPEDTVEVLDDTALDASGYYESVPDDLARCAPMTLDCYWDYALAPPTLGSVGTVTVTFPRQPNQSTAGSMTGSAIITGIRRPSNEVGQRLMGAITIQWDGKTGPTYTAAS